MGVRQSVGSVDSQEFSTKTTGIANVKPRIHAEYRVPSSTVCILSKHG